MVRSNTKETQESLTPEKALELLKTGNYRFVNNLKINRNLLQQVNETRDGQWPFAAILSCIDSRTSAELIFDQGLGDIFSVRIAGNVINEDILGSLEYACKLAGSKLIVVLGHTKCGAIKGACDGVELGNLSSLLNKIRPAVEAETAVWDECQPDNPAFLDGVTQLNVRHSVKLILEQSTVVREMVDRGEVGLVGAVYDVETGAVTFEEKS
ncbi:carbonic anhydrase family protein [Compostibacter hankyongensis]|uniref:Carbonic anhydrase family protein n=1 Tax=Compostibacter hankyongensis TaxID=1007089 RepID=A0ABP8FCB4_9BACT